MRAVIVRSLAVIGVGAVALAGLLYVASTVDARPPEVLSIGVTQPAAGETDTALITTSIEIVFSEPVDADGAASAISITPDVPGTVSWSGSTLIFTPADPLELSTDYTVEVDGTIRDLAGNTMEEAPPAYAFRTAGRPEVAATDPVDGADAVPVESTVAITFSTLMDTASVESALRIRPTFPHDLRWSGELLEVVPREPLRLDTRYEVAIGADAADAAGVAIGEPVRIGFRTVEPGLRASTIVPANGIDGVAVTSPIAVFFDRPIDPDSVDVDSVTLTPSVAGAVDVVAADPAADAEAPSTVLRFTPSGPLPANTTFEVEVAGTVVAASGGTLAEPIRWTFTTGTPAGGLSNQVTFLSDRGGVANVWAMNPDGTGQHQVSAELTPIVDYAVAPDGSSLVVADGTRLVFLRPDGSDRRVLTGDEHLDVDPTYAPNGQRLAFGRGDAATGGGLGLWTWEVGGGDPESVDLPEPLVPGGTAAPSESDDEPGPWIRAPRYAPDGSALAFARTDGTVGILELPAQRLTLVPFTAAARPTWLPDSSAVLLAGSQDTAGEALLEPPVLPLAPGADDAVHRLNRSGTRVTPTVLEPGWQLLAVSGDGRLAVIDPDGALATSDDLDTLDEEAIIPDVVRGAAFAPDENFLVAATDDGSAPGGPLVRVDLASGRTEVLVPDGWMPRWIP
jgi:hypothetical protein